MIIHTKCGCLLVVCWLLFLSFVVTGEESDQTDAAKQSQDVAGSRHQRCNCTCGERNSAVLGTRIVGGAEAGNHEFPWMVRLSYFNRFYCGGTLVNDRYVVTAAHCVRGFIWFMIRVTFGEHNRCDDAEQPETRYVLRAILHQFRSSNFDNDIALLRLNDRVPMTDTIRPICLPTKEGEKYVGARAITTGWGSLGEGDKSSCVMQKVTVPILENDLCVQSSDYTQDMITDGMICAGYVGQGRKDSCKGDSGGPLIVQRQNGSLYELVGVVSWGNGCARPNYPGVYTRVTKFVKWIRTHTKDGCFCSDQ